MADSQTTRIASAIPQSTSRRTLLTAGAAAIGATAVAAPVMAGAPPLSNALAQAIERHKVAQAAIDTAIAKGYGGDLGDIPEHLCDAEFEARIDVAELPAATDAELLRKLRHLFDRECRAWGDNWDASAMFGSVLVTMDLHFNGGTRA